MWKQRLFSVAAFLAVGLCSLTGIGNAQTTRIFGSGVSKGTHFKIETTNNGVTTTENFFPVGWYVNHATINNSAALQAMKDAGINTVVIEAHDVIAASNLGWPYVYSNLKTAINYTLSRLDSYGIKAVIDLAPFLFYRNYPPSVPPNTEHSTFTPTNLTDYINYLLQGNYKHVIFAYYVASEPSTARKINNLNIREEPLHINDLATQVRMLDPNHPCYIDADGKSYTSEGYQQTSYDAFAHQLYGVHQAYKEYASNVEDYNDVAEGAHASFDMVKQNNKYGFITLGSAQDKLNCRSFRAMTPQEEFYQTLSPMIAGARGIFYWWHPSATSGMQNLTHTMTKFLTSKNNQKETSIVDVLMEDEIGADRTSSAQLGSIQINGNSSIPIHGTSVNFTDQAILKQKYRSFNFNKYEKGGSIYRLIPANTAWTKEVSGFNSGNASCIDAATSWRAGRMIRDVAIAGNQLVAAQQNCAMLWTAPLNSMNWSPSAEWMGSCTPDRDIVRVFGTLPSSTTLIAGGDNGHFYIYNPSQSDQCLRWQDKGRIIGPDPYNSNILDTAGAITSFASVGTTLYAGSLKGLYYSTNNGTSWIAYKQISSLLRNNPSETGSDGADSPYPILSLAVNNATNVLYIGSFGRVITKPVSGAIGVFTYSNSGLPNQPVYSLQYRSDGTMFAGTGDGLYYHNTSSSSWLPISGLPTGTRVWDMALSNTNILYLATSSGVYRVDAGTLTLSLNSDNLPSASISSGVEYRAIAVDANGYVYVGTQENGNSFANTRDRSSDLIDNKRHDFPLFNYLVKKHKGSYYVFAVNDFRPTVSVNFNLKDVIDDDETVYRLVEMNLDSTETQLNQASDSRIGDYNFSASFGAYQVRVFRLDVLKWSEVFTMQRECDATSTCETHAGGITIGDFDHDGKKDILAMWVPALATPVTTAAEPFRFKIGWNIQNPLHRASNNPPFIADDYTALSNFSVKNPNKCYGEVERVLVWSGEHIRGGDVKAWRFGSDANQYDVFFMGMPNTAITGPGYEDYRVKFLWDIHPTGSTFTSPLDYFESFYSNFPAPPASPAFGHLQLPRTGTTAATGGGMTFYQNPAEGGLNGSRPELMLMHLTDEPAPPSGAGANYFRFATSRNMYLDNPANPWSQIQYITPGNPQQSVFHIGWETKGAGLDIGNIYPGYFPYNSGVNDKTMELVAGGIETATNEFRFVVSNFDPITGVIDPTWQPSVSVPIRPSGNYDTIKDAGLALSDIDGDGDDDLVIMGISQKCGAGFSRPMFIRFGINTLIDKPNSYKKESNIALEEVPYRVAPTPGISIQTTLHNQPNPFSTGTVVNYSINRAAHIELEVYSMLGEVVLRTDIGLQNAGTYQFPFDGGNLSNGMYMCHLKVNGVVANSTKMMLVR